MFMLLGFAFQCIPFLDLLLCSVSVNCFSSLTFLMSQFSVPGSYSYLKSFPDINFTCLWFTSLFLTLLIEQVIPSTIHSLSTPTAALGKFLPPLNKFSHFGLFHKYISCNVMYVYIFTASSGLLSFTSLALEGPQGREFMLLKLIYL